jgi:hypothetical protein
MPEIQSMDVIYKTGGGLQFGEIWVKDNTNATTLNSAAKVQVTDFANNGESNGTVVPDHINDHITVGFEGRYMVAISVVARNDAAQTHDLELELYVNNGATAFDNVHSHRTLPGGVTSAGSISMNGICNFSASDTVELWATTNAAANRDVVFEDVTMSIFQIGGSP